jgi:6-phosphogluconolactonase
MHSIAFPSFSRVALAAAGLASAALLSSCGGGHTIGYAYVLSSPGTTIASILTYNVNSNHGQFYPSNAAQFPALTASAIAAAVTPDGANLYVLYGATTDVQTGLPVDNGLASIVHYGIHPDDGTITALDTAETGGTEPVALAIDPSGNFLYAVDTYRPGFGNGSPGVGDVTIFQLQNGVPSLPSSCPLPLGTVTAEGNGCYYSVGFGPRGVTQSQSANGTAYVYVANSGNTAPQIAGTCYGTLSGFTLGADGGLTPLNFSSAAGSCANGGNPFPANTLPLGTNPWGITTATLSGNAKPYVYVTDYGAGGVYALATTGGVPQLPGTFSQTGGEPEHVLAGPNSGALFVSNFAQGTVSSFTIGSIGQLTPSTNPNYVVGTGPTCMTIDQSGTYFYVTNYLNGNVSAFYLVGASGQLAEVPNQPFLIGTGVGLGASNPTCLAIAPNRTPQP